MAVEQRDRLKQTIPVGKPAIVARHRIGQQSVDARKHLLRRPGRKRAAGAVPRPGAWDQILRKASVALVPPNPKELDRTTSSFISRAVLGT